MASKKLQGNSFQDLNPGQSLKLRPQLFCFENAHKKLQFQVQYVAQCMKLITELDESEQEKIQSAAKVENDVEYTRFSTNDVSVVIEVGKEAI